MIDSVAAGILLEIVFGGRVSCRFRWSLDLDVRHQDSKCIGIVLREMLAQDATDGFRHVVECLPLHLRPKRRSTHRTWDRYAGSFCRCPSRLVSDRKACVALSYSRESLYQNRYFRSCEDNTISSGGMSIISYRWVCRYFVSRKSSLVLETHPTTQDANNIGNLVEN